MTYKDIRQQARDCLKGKWLMAALVTFLAGLMGVRTGGFNFNINIGSGNVPPTHAQDSLSQITSTLPSAALLSKLIPFAPAVLILSLILSVIGMIVMMGYHRYALNLADHQEARIDDLFSQFQYAGKAIGLQLLKALYIIWPILLLIPLGILFSSLDLMFFFALSMVIVMIPCFIAVYRYAMAPYILLENPDMTVPECLRASRELMDGHKGELFTLHLTFLGWSLLCLFTLGIGNYFLTPYMVVSDCIFYREIQGYGAVIVNHAAPLPENF